MMNSSMNAPLACGNKLFLIVLIFAERETHLKKTSPLILTSKIEATPALEWLYSNLIFWFEDNA